MKNIRYYLLITYNTSKTIKLKTIKFNQICVTQGICIFKGENGRYNLYKIIYETE